MTAPSTVIGTAFYMSPEQAKGLEIDASTDQYAFALILYEALTGRRARKGTNQMQVLNEAATGALVPLSKAVPALGADLVAAISRGLAVAPRDRYPSMRAFGAALLPFASPRTRSMFDAELASSPELVSSPEQTMVLPHAPARAASAPGPQDLGSRTLALPLKDREAQAPITTFTHGAAEAMRKRRARRGLIGVLPLAIIAVALAVWRGRSPHPGASARTARPVVMAPPPPSEPPPSPHAEPLPMAPVEAPPQPAAAPSTHPARKHKREVRRRPTFDDDRDVLPPSGTDGVPILP